jgi:hypothetical protein
VSIAEDFLTFYADPGEDFGWALGCGTTLVARGITKMWTTADVLWEALNDGPDKTEFFDPAYIRDEIDAEDYQDMWIERIVCEDFRIYPWAAKDLAWDRVRTARVIGAMTFMARRKEIPFILQPAAIKKAAVAAGAEELFDKPLYENRHSNDAIMHFTFFTATELLGLNMPVPAVSEDDQ